MQNINDINEAYGKIVFWRKNMFRLSAGNVKKKCINEVTRPLNAWTQYTSLISFIFKSNTQNIDDLYEKIVFWRKNLSILPTGNAENKYVKEVTRLMNK